MINLSSDRLLPVAYALCIVAASWFHLFTPLNIDSAWLITAASRSLDGEHLYIDYIETNPPLIIWLNLIPAKLAEISPLSLHSSLSLTMALLISWNIWYIARLSLPLRLVLTYALTITLLAHHDISQREHLFILLAAPYFTTLLMEKSPSLKLAFIAAIGIALKPFFILVFITVCSIIMIRNRSIHMLTVAANLLIFGLCLAYNLYVFSNHAYRNEVAAYFSIYYYETLDPELVLAAMVLLGSLAFIYELSFILPKTTHWIHTFFWLAMLGVLIVYLQFKGSHNHWYIYFFFSTLFFSEIVGLCWQQRKLFRANMLMVLSLILLFSHLALHVIFVYEIITPNSHKQVIQKIAFLDHLPIRSIGSLAFDLDAAFPATTELQLYHTSRYPHLWFLPYFYSDHDAANQSQPEYHLPSEMSVTEKRFFDLVIENFIQHPPDLMIVEKNTYCHSNNDICSFDFINYYMQDYRFADLWKYYNPIARFSDSVYYYHSGVSNKQ